MIRPLLVFFLLSLFTATLKAAEPQQVSGTITDRSGVPIKGAFVTRLALPDSIMSGIAYSDDDGKYRIESDSIIDRSVLMVTMVSYKRIFKPVDGETVNFRLDENITELDELTVSSKKSRMMSFPGEIAYFPTDLYKEMRNASHLVENIPLLNCNREGINIFSKSGNALIMVNMRPIDMPYEVFKEMLKKMPPKSIKAVNIVFSPPTSFDNDIYNTGIVNFIIDDIIVGTVSGISSNLTLANLRPASYSTLWSSWQNDAWQVTGSIYYNQNANNEKSTTNYINHLNRITTKSVYTDRIDTHLISGSLSGQYTFGERQEHILTLSATMGGNRSWTDRSSTIESDTEDERHTYAESHQVSLTPFGKPFSRVGASYTFNGQNDFSFRVYAGASFSPENNNRTDMNYSGILIDSNSIPNGFNQLSGSKSSGESGSFYFVKGWRSIGLTLNGSYTIGYGENKFHNDINFEENERFGYSELSNNLSASLSWNKSIFGIRAGIRMEQFRRKCTEYIENTVNTANFVNFCPDIALSSNLKGGLHTLGLDYRAMLRKPTYNALNPMKVWISETMYRQGDPYMKPYLIHQFYFRYGLLGVLNASISYTYSSKGSDEKILPSPDEPGVTVLKRATLGYSHSFSARIRFEKWFFDQYLRVHGSACYEWSKHTAGATEILADSHSSFFNIEGGISYKISKTYDWEAAIGSYYFTNTKLVGQEASSKAGLNFVIGKAFKFGLEFYVRYSQPLTDYDMKYYSDAYEYVTDYCDFRKPKFSISLEYVFGNSKVKRVNSNAGAVVGGILPD